MTQEPRPTPDEFSSYRSVPTTVSAVRFTDENKDRIFRALTGNHAADYVNGEPVLTITTVHGETAIVRLGDWIVEDSVLGTYYPVKHDVFGRKYLQPPVHTLTPEQVERARRLLNVDSPEWNEDTWDDAAYELLREVVGDE